MSPSVLDFQPCKVPLRRVGAFDIFLSVHEGIAEDVLEADQRWRALGGRDFFVIRQADTGSYNCRNSVGHSRAVAIDFNWVDQGMHKRTAPGSAACKQLPGMKAFYEKCWKPLGYGWGANWRSKCDGMHVSKVVSEGGDGRLYVPRGAVTTPPPTPGTPAKTYRVQSGDTLSSIASRFGTTWQQLARINSLPNPNRLEVGQVLKLRPEPGEHSHSTPTLRRGSRGEAVRDLQSHLRIAIDADFGPQTEAAVRNFQSTSGLKADAIVGARTWKGVHS